jgi:hypothetical protein
MITIRIGDEPFNTAVLIMMVGALIGYFIGRGIAPMFEADDEIDHPPRAKHGSK